MNPDRLTELETERRFLLDSLRDLEIERDAGDVDDHDYESLKEGYTARAAAVLRELDAGHAHAPAPPRGRRWGAIAAWVTAVVVFAAAAGVFVARQSGERLPGGSGGGEPSVSELLSDARAQLNPADPSPALDLYAQVLDVEPDNAEALTYLGWLSVLSAVQEEDVQLQAERFQSGLVLLRQVTLSDPTYADAHCFLGISLFRFAGDAESAKPEIEACLDANPPADVADLVATMSEQIDEALSEGTAAP